MTKMLGISVALLLFLAGVALGVPLGEIWDFQNESVFGKVKKVEELDDSGLLVRAVYYNEKGQKTKIEGYIDGILTHKYTMEYNKDGDPFRASYYLGVGESPDLIETAEYVSKGVIKYIVLTGKVGEEEKTLTTEPFEYDENKRLKSIKLNAKNGFTVYDYKFDDDGNCTEVIWDREDYVHSEVKYGKYINSVPGTIEMQFLYSNKKMSKMLRSLAIEYKFDMAGNWIEKTIENVFKVWDSREEDNKPRVRKSNGKVNRTITYYPDKKKIN